MRSGARWWRLRRRVTHVGMRLLLRWLRRMSVNHPAPGAKPVTSFRNHFFFVWGCTTTLITVGSFSVLFC